MAAHQFLVAHGESGYVTPEGDPQPRLPGRRGAHRRLRRPRRGGRRRVPKASDGPADPGAAPLTPLPFAENHVLLAPLAFLRRRRRPAGPAGDAVALLRLRPRVRAGRRRQHLGQGRRPAAREGQRLGPGHHRARGLRRDGPPAPRGPGRRQPAEGARAARGGLQAGALAARARAGEEPAARRSRRCCTTSCPASSSSTPTPPWSTCSPAASAARRSPASSSAARCSGCPTSIRASCWPRRSGAAGRPPEGARARRPRAVLMAEPRPDRRAATRRGGARSTPTGCSQTISRRIAAAPQAPSAAVRLAAPRRRRRAGDGHRPGPARPAGRGRRPARSSPSTTARQALAFAAAACARAATAGGPLTPDQIVYCKSFPLWFDPVDGRGRRRRWSGGSARPSRRTAASTGCGPQGDPGPGRWACSPRATTSPAPTRLRAGLPRRDQGHGRRERLGGVQALSEANREFIEDWEVESYRKQVAQRAGQAGPGGRQGGRGHRRGPGLRAGDRPGPRRRGRAWWCWPT